jgi:signal transduction histidine kinase
MERLSDSERQRILLELVVSLQHAADLDSALAHLLAAITGEIGYSGAVVTLVDDERQALYPWIKQEAEQTTAVLLNRTPDPLDDGGNPLIAVLEKGEAAWLDLADEFEIENSYVVPLRWGVLTIGLLLVDASGFEEDLERQQFVQEIGEQAGVSLGMMQTRHRRAKESAVQEERARLALDLHDTISQSLFGLVSTLQACRTMLPDDPQTAEQELDWALQTAENVRQMIRDTVRDLWPAELTAEQFEADLRQYAADILQAAELDITFDVRGDFASLSPPVRRSIYRISQEALANIVHHARARESRICVDVADGRVQFIVRDNGRGFDPQTILALPYAGDHFGLRGMQERAAALGGSCRIYSQPDAGTSIVIEMPANLQAHHRVQ